MRHTERSSPAPPPQGESHCDDMMSKTSSCACSHVLTTERKPPKELGSPLTEIKEGAGRLPLSVSPSFLPFKAPSLPMGFKSCWLRQIASFALYSVFPFQTSFLCSLLCIPIPDLFSPIGIVEGSHTVCCYVIISPIPIFCSTISLIPIFYFVFPFQTYSPIVIAEGSCTVCCYVTISLIPILYSIFPSQTTFSESPITEIFGGELRSAVHRQGAKESATMEPFFSLQLDIQVSLPYSSCFVTQATVCTGHEFL